MSIKTDNDYLLVAGENNEPEIFYTLEGEGEHIGKPSVFLRLFGCNLTCKGFASTDSPFGCDSFISWSKKNKLTFTEVFEIFEKNNFVEKLEKGAILKLTGGEPMLRQSPLQKFIDQFINKYGFVPIIDFETNATILPEDYWHYSYNATFTTSPKLSNNGDPVEKRYDAEVIKYHAHIGSGFKFVISSEEDIKEVMSNYVHKFYIPSHRVWFMPCCGSRAEHLERATQVAEWSKEYGVNFSPRLHLLLWDKATRV
jgi:organic radical activating enzyme